MAEAVLDSRPKGENQVLPGPGVDSLDRGGRQKNPVAPLEILAHPEVLPRLEHPAFAQRDEKLRSRYDRDRLHSVEVEVEIVQEATQCQAVYAEGDRKAESQAPGVILDRPQEKTAGNPDAGHLLLAGIVSTQTDVLGIGVVFEALGIDFDGGLLGCEYR